jgi:hypothetical protein
MRRFFYYAISIVGIFWIAGCFNLQLDKPLVDLGQDESSTSSTTTDSDPDEPDDEEEDD